MKTASLGRFIKLMFCVILAMPYVSTGLLGADRRIESRLYYRLYRLKFDFDVNLEQQSDTLNF